MLDIVRHTPQDASTSVDRWRQTLGVDLEGSTLGVLDLKQFGLGFARFGLALTLRRICPLPRWPLAPVVAGCGDDGLPVVQRPRGGRRNVVKEDIR